MTDRAVITGKLSPDGSSLLPETGELTHAILMAAIHNRAAAHGITSELPHRSLDACYFPQLRQGHHGIVQAVRIIPVLNCPTTTLLAWVWLSFD